MQKKPRFPHSQELFRFAKAVRAHRTGAKNVSEVADYEVGQLLGFSRDLTSRFKTGDRDYTSAAVIHRLAARLEMDCELLLRVAVGELDADQAMKLLQKGGGGEVVRNANGKAMCRVTNQGLKVEDFRWILEKVTSIARGG